MFEAAQPVGLLWAASGSKYRHISCTIIMNEMSLSTASDRFFQISVQSVMKAAEECGAHPSRAEGWLHTKRWGTFRLRFEL